MSNNLHIRKGRPLILDCHFSEPWEFCKDHLMFISEEQLKEYGITVSLKIVFVLDKFGHVFEIFPQGRKLRDSFRASTSSKIAELSKLKFKFPYVELQKIVPNLGWCVRWKSWFRDVDGEIG